GNWFTGFFGFDMKQSPPDVIETDKFLQTIGGIFAVTYERGKGIRAQNIVPVSHPETGAFRFLASPYNQHGGPTLYDRNIDPMPNGTLDVSYRSLEKNIIVVPFIHDPDKYYVFTFSRTSDLNYSVVDMTLNNGLGDVVPGLKDRHVRTPEFADPFTNFIDVVPGNNCDLWLLAVESDYDMSTAYTLSAYHITDSGIDTTPVVAHYNKESMWDMFWDFKVSPDRESIAFIILNYIENRPSSRVHFLRFDPENGAITTDAYPTIELSETDYRDMHGCFTPDNTAYIVYKHDYYGGNMIFHKYALNENMRHTSSTYPLSYPEYNWYKYSAYTPPIIFLKPYGNKIFFNIPQHYSLPDPDDMEQKLKKIGQYTCVKLGTMKPLGDGWQQVDYDPEITLTRTCRLQTNSDVVYPYLAFDTMPSVYFDTVFCFEPNTPLGSIKLKARPGFTDYIWNDGSTGNEREIHTPGKYWVYFKSGCNNIRVDSFIFRFRAPVVVLPPDTVICDQRFPLTVKPKEAGDYRWEDNSTIPERNIYAPGTYWVTFEAEGCTQYDTLTVGSEHCPCNISVPNAFSPNNDGLNDYFKPTIALGCVPVQYSLLIYNRWGQMIYKSNNEFDRGWDGTYNGRSADMGSYFYELRFKTDARPEPYYHKGELVLIR
ncbi:gliding motility-associated C-terminal domain-containing protein, partial [Taibaiella chishuiensis]